LPLKVRRSTKMKLRVTRVMWYCLLCRDAETADVLDKNLLLDLQRKLYIIKVRWQVKKGR